MGNLVFLASKKHIKTYFLASKALFNHKTAGIYPSSIASDGGRTSSSVRWLPHASPYVRSPYWTPQQTERNALSSHPLCIAAQTFRQRSSTCSTRGSGFHQRLCRNRWHQKAACHNSDKISVLFPYYVCYCYSFMQYPLCNILLCNIHCAIMCKDSADESKKASLP